MGIFNHIFGRKEHNVNIGQEMAEIYLENHMPDALKKRLTKEGNPSIDLHEYYLIKCAVDFSGYVLAAESGLLKIKDKQKHEIGQNFIQNLVLLSLPIFKNNSNLEDEHQKIMNYVSIINKAYQDNINKEPSPFWYVGIAVHKLIHGENASNPALVTLYGYELKQSINTYIDVFKDFRKVGLL